MSDTLNIHSDVCQIFPNKTGKKVVLRLSESDSVNT